MPKIVSNPHDQFFRTSMSNSRVAKEFFETYLPESIQRITNLSTLELKKESFVDEALRSHLTDMLYAVEINEKPSYLYLLVEHQSTSDPLMPFRLLKYNTLAIDQHLKQKGGTELPLIYPLVLYNGAKKYRDSTDLFRLFRDNEALARQVFLQPFHLIDLSQMPDEDLKQQTWLSILLLCLKHTAEDALQWIGAILDNLYIIEQEGGVDYTNTAFTYLFAVGTVTDANLFVETIHNHLSQKSEKNMLTIGEQFKEMGRQEAARKFEKDMSAIKEMGRQEMAQKIEKDMLAIKEMARKLEKNMLAIKEMARQEMAQKLKKDMPAIKEMVRQEMAQELALRLITAGKSVGEVIELTDLPKETILAMQPQKT